MIFQHQLLAIHKKMQLLKLKIWKGRNLLIGIPYFWMLFFFLLPFLVILKFSFAERFGRKLGQFTDVINFDSDKLLMSFNFHFGNYDKLISFSDYSDTVTTLWEKIVSNLYWLSYIESFKIAVIATILCLIIAYPFAWAISVCKNSTRNLLLLLVILPSWTAFLIRIYAWQSILNNNTGILNQLLMWLGIIDYPLEILNTQLAVYIGIIYCYLPFAILPIYASITKIDTTLIEASLDLGCKPLKTFFKVALPLTKSGVIAGGMLVFIPTLGEYVIPELLGGSNSLMVGKRLMDVFNTRANWPMASALAVVMLIILIIPILYFNKLQNQTGENK